MMALLHSWRESLSLFHPKTCSQLFFDGFKAWLHASKTVISFFKWFLLLDAVVHIMYGDVIMLVLQQAQKGATAKIAPGVTLMYIASNILWFVMSAGFLLFIRRRVTAEGATSYFKVFFFRYVQLALFFSLATFIILSLVISLGVTTMPSIHWTFLLGVRIVELIAMFYWLDGANIFRNTFVALENSVNMLLYNLPVFVGLFLIAAGIVWAVSQGLALLPHIPYEALLQKITQLLGKSPQGFIFLLIKYGKVLLEFLGVSILFALYNTKKDITYAQSLFH